MSRLFVAMTFAFLLLLAVPAAAQSDGMTVQVGGQVTAIASSEFNDADFGLGGRVSWHPTSLIGTEAELMFYPQDLAGEGTPALSEGRLEGLFGLTVGPVLGGLRPFGKVRPGFVAYKEAPSPVPCVQIFPPPLACALAAGETLFALDLGGGLEIFPTVRTFVRIDASDRMVRYQGPALDRGRVANDEDYFFGHDFRFSVGGGVRF